MPYGVVVVGAGLAGLGVIHSPTESERIIRAHLATMTDGLSRCGDFREKPAMQGAMMSGRRAADAVLADLGAR